MFPNEDNIQANLMIDPEGFLRNLELGGCVMNLRNSVNRASLNY
jgi:hypothetical protein